MPLKLSESTNILFIRIIYSIRIPYILWNDGLLSTLILFLEIFRSHAELFQKQFAEIRRRINTHHITDISNPIFTFLNIFRRFLEPDQTDKVKWGKIKYRFNFSQQTGTTHTKNIRHFLHSEIIIGYMWGTAGILFNTDHVPAEDARTWASLWNLKYKNKILMKESYRDAYGTALIYANAEDLKKGKVTVEELMNNYSQASIDTVEKYLKAMKPLIAGWEADFGKEMMTKGKAWLNMTWSGDAVWAIEEAEGVGIHLDYEVPMEGSNVWYDGWVIPKYARNKKAASYFINYLCRPDVALRNMDACGYVSAVATPEILEAKIDTTLSYFADLSYFFGPAADSIQIDKVQYPDRTVVERCAMIRDSGDKTELVLEMWSRVKGDNLGVGVVIVILVSAGIMVVFTVYRKLQRYQHEKAQYPRRNHRRKK